MMRRGDLAQHPVGQVLRQAASEGLSGGIDFHTGTPSCVHLVDGQVYLAVAADRPVAVDLDGHLDDRALAAEERRVRDHTVEVLTRLLPADDGWYYFHPLNHHPLRGWWQWDTGQLLSEALRRSSGDARGPEPDRQGDHGREADRPALGLVDLLPSPPPRPPGPEAWAVIVALAQPASYGDLARKLGWTEDQLAAVVAEMAAVGLISDHRPPTSTTPPPEEDVAPGPSTIGTQRSALRRLIDSLRAAS